MRSLLPIPHFLDQENPSEKKEIARLFLDQAKHFIETERIRRAKSRYLEMSTLALKRREAGLHADPDYCAHVCS